MHRLYLSEFSTQHQTPPGHPEAPGRVGALMHGFYDPQARPLPLDRLMTTAANMADLKQAHTPYYLNSLATPVPNGGWRAFDQDTGMSTHSYTAALHSAGGAIEATRAVLSGQAQTAFVATRPPGHHALADKAMGFCFLGNAALAALTATTMGARVAVLDFDVHHGNGTQALLWNTPNTLFASTHVLNAWPQTGKKDETGAFGTFLNVPLKNSAGDTKAVDAWTHILDQVKAFAPDLVIVSAGFDAHQSDPIGSMRWTTPTFKFLGTAIADIADALCGGRVVSVLEGGYNLTVLRHAGRAYMEGLLFGV